MGTLGDGDGGNWPPDGPTACPACPRVGRRSSSRTTSPSSPRSRPASARELRRERPAAALVAPAHAAAVRPDEAGRPTVRLPALDHRDRHPGHADQPVRARLAAASGAGRPGRPALAERLGAAPADPAGAGPARTRRAGLSRCVPSCRRSILLIDGLRLRRAGRRPPPRPRRSGSRSLVVARQHPPRRRRPWPGLENVRPLADPAGELRVAARRCQRRRRERARCWSTGDGEIVRALAHADSVDAFQADLASLVTT